MTTTRKTRRSSRLDKESSGIDGSSSPNSPCNHLLGPQDVQLGLQSEFELNSSPISGCKKKDYDGTRIVKKKSVAFSDDIGYDLVSSPIKDDTPRKSILKSSNLNSDLGLFNSKNYNGSNDSQIDITNCHESSFWQQGNIVQLPPNHNQLNQLVEGCISVLANPKFQNRFEVYATLNSISKKASGRFWIGILSMSNNNKQSLLVRLVELIKEDIVNYENELFDYDEAKENSVIGVKSDPFRIRVVTQALKLFNSFMIDEDLNNLLPVDDIRWLYEHASIMLIKPNVSKALMSPYLLILKDCKFNVKKKKLIFEDSKLIETMLSSLVNMRSLPSSSIMTEKFFCFRNFLSGFPGIMGKNISHWIGVLIIQILSLPLSYTKCIASGVNTLLEVAKIFLDNRNALIVMKQFCGSPIPLNQVQYFSEPYSMNCSDSWTLDDLGIDFIISRLETLVKSGQFRMAVDIWLAITLMVGSSDSYFEKWILMNKWLQVHKSCFASNISSARLNAITSWRAIIYSICQNGLNQIWKLIDPITKDGTIKDKQTAINTLLQPKIELLNYAISSIDTSQVSNEELDAIHNLNLMIIYSLMNTTSNKSSTKYMYLFWDKLVHQLFKNLYFSNQSSPYLHNLGWMLFNRFLQQSSTTNEKNMNNLRCLINEEISLHEINCLSPRWVHSKSDKVIQTLVLVFELKFLNTAQKCNLFNSFINNIKIVTKKEITPSDISTNLIDNLSKFVEVFKIVPIDFDKLYRILTNLHDTFDPDLLITRGSSNCDLHKNTFYYLLFSITFNTMSEYEITSIITFTMSSISEKYIVKFLTEMFHLGTKFEHSRKIALAKLENRKILCNSLELLFYGTVCGSLAREEDVFIRKVFLVILDSGDIDKYLASLNIDSWSQEAFQNWSLLVKESSSKELKESIRNSMNKKLDNEEDFITFTKFMIQNNFDAELFSFKEKIQNKIGELEGFERFEFSKLWHQYVLTMKKSMDSNVWSDLVEIKPTSNTPNCNKIENSNDIVSNEQHGVKLEGSGDEKFGIEDIELSNSGDPPKDEDFLIEIFDDYEVSTDRRNCHQEIEVNVAETNEKALVADDVNENENQTKVNGKGRKKILKSKSPKANTTKVPFDIHSFAAMLSAKLAQTLKEEVQVSKKRKSTAKSRKKASNKLESVNDAKLEGNNEVQVESLLTERLSQAAATQTSLTSTEDNICSHSQNNELSESLRSSIDNDRNLRRSRRKRGHHDIETEPETKKKVVTRSRTRIKNDNGSSVKKATDELVDSSISTDLFVSTRNVANTRNESKTDTLERADSEITFLEVNVTPVVDINGVRGGGYKDAEPIVSDHSSDSKLPEASNTDIRQNLKEAVVGTNLKEASNTDTKPNLEQAEVGNNLKQIRHLLQTITDEQLKTVNQKDKYDIETVVIEFISRIRKSQTELVP